MDADSDYFFYNGSNIYIEEPHNTFGAFQLYAAVYMSIIFLVSMPGNSFLLWVLLRDKAWRTTSDILLLQLTVSNLCFTATLPFFVCNALNGWIFGEWACRVIRGLCVLGLYTYTGILTAMAFHSYVIVIKLPCLSTQTSSQLRVLISSTMIWLLSAAMSIMLAVNGHVVDLYYDDMKVCIFEIQSVTVMFVKICIQMCFHFFIPVIIVMFCYLHMWVMIKLYKTSNCSWPSKITLGLTVSSLLCLAPHSIHIFIESLMAVGAIEHNYESIHARHYVQYIILPLYNFCCCLSPLFQILGAQRFRRQLTWLCRTPPQNREGNNTTSMRVMLLENVNV